MKKYKHLNEIERLEMSILLKKKYSIREIAKVMDRSHSALSREIRRNSVKGEYNPKKAQHKAYVNRKYSKYQAMKVVENEEILDYIGGNIKKGWSPEIIAGRLYVEKGISIKHDTIYKYLYSSRGQHLCKYLKSKRYIRKNRKLKKRTREIIKDRIFISERPEHINKRMFFGDFEADTMGRPKSTSSRTLVVMRERLSRKIFAEKVKTLGKTIEGFKKIKQKVKCYSITLDNGVENARHKELNVKTYFCNPYSSWEKGSVEQGIKLIREYIPKKADLIYYTNKQIQEIIDKINNRPMKCLGYLTPNEVFEQQTNLSNNHTGALRLQKKASMLSP